MERFVNEMNAPTSTMPPSGNTDNQSYQNSEAPPTTSNNHQTILDNQVTLDATESNA